MDDIESLIASAERVSKCWRLGTDKTKDTMRDALNELDWVVADVKKRVAKEATTKIERKS